MTALIVVGAGFFGMVAARLAQKHGYDVIVIDDGRPGRGSAPAAGLIKPSWLDGFGDPGKRGLDTLDELFGLEVLPFTIRPSGLKVDVNFIHPRRVLDQKGLTVLHATVEAVGDGYVQLVDGSPLHGHVYVAAGVWTQQLLTHEGIQLPTIQRLRGSAFFWEGRLNENILSVWAPYRQVKVFNIEEDVIWAGDSTGLKPASYTPERMLQSQNRCAKVLDTKEPPYTVATGDRPYIPGHRLGYFARVFPNTWVGTGGAKMGATLAGWNARLLLAELRRAPE